MNTLNRTAEGRATGHGSTTFEMIQAAFAATMRFFRNRFAIKELAELDDALLKDLGLTRHDVNRAYYSAASEDPMTDLQQSAARRAQRMIV